MVAAARHVFAGLRAKLIEHMRKELQDDKGLGVAFIREAGATDSIKRLGQRPRR